MVRTRWQDLRTYPLPRHWVVERTNAWAARFRRLTRDYERLQKVLAGARFAALGCCCFNG